MSLKSSAIGNLKLHINFASSNVSDPHVFGRCYNFTAVRHMISSLFATNVLFISPLYFIVLHLGFQQCRKCCSPPSAPSRRQSDLFTYNMVAMALIEVVACGLDVAGMYTAVFEVAEIGFFIFYVCWYVKLFFHTVTCIERYLAVVHPVTYLGLKNETGSRIRSTVIGFTWLLLLVWVVSTRFMGDFLNVMVFVSHLSFSFIVMFFCCVSVLWALKRPQPGQAACDRKHTDQTKRRAFCTILTIMSTVLLTLVWVLVSNVLYAVPLLHLEDKCLMAAFVPWVSLPCNLVLPILYLQRAGKLPQCTQTFQ